MLRDRIPHWLAFRVISAAFILALLPTTLLVNPAMACTGGTVYWYGSNSTVDQAKSLTSYNWSTVAKTGQTNWDDGDKNIATYSPLKSDAAVIFPDWAANKHATNDKPAGFLVYNMKFDGTTGYVVDGNAIQLAENITSTKGSNELALNIDFIKTDGPQYITVGTGADLQFSGSISGPGVVTQSVD
jgi:hypothetical protein